MNLSVWALSGTALSRRPETIVADRAEVEEAFRTIIRWTGDDPSRGGLIETPSRMARAFEEYFAGYGEDPALMLQKTFEEIEGYDEMIVLRGIRFESHCEHHLAPIIGQAWVGYVPNGRMVGISKLARVVEAYARRLQIQERMTAQIASAIAGSLNPQGVGVIIKAAHHCMTPAACTRPTPIWSPAICSGAFAITRRRGGSFSAWRLDSPFAHK